MNRPFRRRRPGRVLAVLAGLTAVGLGLWGWGLFAFVAALPDRVAEPDRRTDAIVVLTGGSGRLEAALDLLAAGRADRLFVSGVYRGVDVRRLLETFARDPARWGDRVAIGNAMNTTGNAVESAAWARQQGVTSLRLVTADYHMPRSLEEFRARMPGVELVAHPVFPAHVKRDQWWSWPGTAFLLAREYTKFLAAWAFNRLRGLFLGPVKG
ncbi:MAG: YdcF family protein [Rhodobacterales bacterium]|nr:YdcF family protein [Rhodobacterales bacterium]